MAGAWEIREGARGDLPRLESAWRALYAHHRSVKVATPALIPADERWPARLAEFERAFDEGTALILVAELDGEPIGFAFSVLHRPDPIFVTGPVAELEVLVVLPEHRGEGVGEALVARSRELLRERGAETLKVVVMAGNDAALRFYDRLGIGPALIELLAPLTRGSGESGPTRD